MPKLSKFVRDNADLAERFLVVGVGGEGTTVADVRARVLAKKPPEPFTVDVLPVLLVENERLAMTTAYDPGALGEKVLLDPNGDVVAWGDAATERLTAELRTLRGRVERETAALAEAKSPGEVEHALGALLGLGLPPADAAAEAFARDCPIALAKTALGVLAERGRGDVLLPDQLSGKDAKRRAVALDAMTAHPRPAFTTPLLAHAARKDVKPDEARLALAAVVGAAPDHPELLARLEQVIKRGDIPARAACLSLLVGVRTPAAKERLLRALLEDPGRVVRVAAARALVSFGGDDVRKALEKVAAEDKIEEVKVAAKKALDQLAKQPPAAPK